MRAFFQVQVPGGLIFGGAILRRVFCVSGLGGLYLEGLIHGGAYFRNFTVYQLLVAELIILNAEVIDRQCVCRNNFHLQNNSAS